VKSEEKARQEIDRLLAAAGWEVQDVAQADLHAARGVALREFPLSPGHGIADYLLYLDGKAMFDTAVYNHVALGLILLKYVSDAFKELAAPRSGGRRRRAPASFGPESTDKFRRKPATSWHEWRYLSPTSFGCSSPESQPPRRYLSVSTAS